MINTSLFQQNQKYIIKIIIYYRVTTVTRWYTIKNNKHNRYNIYNVIT